MQNGADIEKEQAEFTLHPPLSSVYITEAEISLEAIKLGKHSASLTESGASIGGDTNLEQVDDSSEPLDLVQKGTKNDTSPDTSVPDKPDITHKPQEPLEKKGENEGETTGGEVKDNSALESDHLHLVSEDEAAGIDEGLDDSIAADDSVMAEPHMESLSKTKDSEVLPQKKKRGRPKKLTDDKTKKKSGRPRKSSFDQTTKPPDVNNPLDVPESSDVTKPDGIEPSDVTKIPDVASDQEKDEVPNSTAPNSNVEVDLFTYVPGKTSEPIQLSTVSSVVSGSEGGSAASLDGDSLVKEAPSVEGGNSEVKKLLKSKLLKNASPNSEKSRKRKMSSEKESQGKMRKASPRPPAEDSSSLQKKQDMIDFLHATEKVLSEQDADAQMEVQGVASDRSHSDDAFATALMAKGPCLDLDEDESKNPQTPKLMDPLTGKKPKRKYVRKSLNKKGTPKSPENLKSLAEIATVSRSFEALNTSDPVEGVEYGGGMTTGLTTIHKPAGNVASAKVGRPRKYKKKGNLAALKAKLAKQKSIQEAVLDIHNGEMITPSKVSDESHTATTENTKVKDEHTKEGDDDDQVNPSVQTVNETVPEPVGEKKLSKVVTPKSKYRRRRFHNWNKKKKHTPAVLQRLANQLKAFQEYARLEAEYLAQHPEENPNSEQQGVYEHQTVGPLAPEASGVPVAQIEQGGLATQLNLAQTSHVRKNIKNKGSVSVKKKMKKLSSVSMGPDSELSEGLHAGSVELVPGMYIAKKGRKKSVGGKKKKKASPVVQLSPLGSKKHEHGIRNIDSFSEVHQSEGSSVIEEPPHLTKMPNVDLSQTISTSSQALLSPQLSADHNSPYGDQHSDMSTSSSKRSYLKPKPPQEFEKDTGAVCLKNILPGRRKYEPKKKFGMMAKYGIYNKVAHGRVEKKGTGRSYNKSYKRGLSFSRSDLEPDIGNIDSKHSVAGYTDFTNQIGGPGHTSTRSPSPIIDYDPVHPGRSYYNRSPNHKAQSRVRERHATGEQIQSTDVFSDDLNRSPSSHHHRPRERQHSRGRSNIHRQSSSGQYSGHKHSFSEDTDAPSSSERNSNRSYTESPKGKGVIGSTVGAVISQLFGDEIPRLAPGSGYVINVRLDVERKEATGTRKSHKSVSTQEDLDGGERRRHSSHHSTSREKSTHVSSTVNSYTRKSQSSEPQPSTSSTPDDPYPRESTTPRPRISDVDLCAMLEERISSRHGLRVDVRDNLLDNIKHVERVLKESS